MATLLTGGAHIQCGRNLGGRNRVVGCQFRENKGGVSSGLRFFATNEIIYSVVDSCLFENSIRGPNTIVLDLGMETYYSDFGATSEYRISNSTFLNDRDTFGFRILNSEGLKLIFNNNFIQHLNKKNGFVYLNLPIKNMIMSNCKFFVSNNILISLPTQPQSVSIYNVLMRSKHPQGESSVQQIEISSFLGNLYTNIDHIIVDDNSISKGKFSLNFYESA